MTFGLIGWLKSRHRGLDYEIPVWYPSREKRDNREWLVVNGLGGFSMGTVCGANRRRYHSVMNAALTTPVARHVVLSRVEEVVKINDVEYELATNAWASGVVSPTGYKRLECFTTLPTPTWVYELDGHYLIKRLVMPHGKNEVYLGYTLLPDPEKTTPQVELTARFLIGFRDFHREVKGSSDDRYPQFVSPKQTMIILNESGARLCLAWSEGQYEAQKQWWWDYRWAEEGKRGEPDGEDLFLVGTVTSKLADEKETTIGASFENAISTPDCHQVVEDLIARQSLLVNRASLPRSSKTDILVLACDQFFVPAFETVNATADTSGEEVLNERLSIIEGYPWFNDCGRAALTSLPGLALSTRRFAEAKAVLRTFAGRRSEALIANRTLDPNPPITSLSKPRLEYNALDTSLWFAWSLWHYYRITKDKELVLELFPTLIEIYRGLRDATTYGITLDKLDGLLDCELSDVEFSWMDSRVEEIPITPRAGKACELNALWYNFLETCKELAAELAGEELVTSGKAKTSAAASLNSRSVKTFGDAARESARYLNDTHYLNDLAEMSTLSNQVAVSMAKFWNSDLSCLYDVIEKPTASGERSRKRDESIRPNQLYAVALPHRAFTRDQEKSILHAIESQLVTPMGLRTLSPQDPQYQSMYGCGFEHADQYHRDLSYHQGTVWTHLMSTYIEALINVYGPLPETVNRVRLLLSPLLEHLTEEALLGSISEIFDGASPHLPRGCPASAQAVAACMRWQNWLLKQ